MVASFQLTSCSSSDGENEIPEVPKNFNITGKWMTLVSQPLDDMTFDEAKVFATSFQIPYVEFVQVGNSGTMTWFEFDDNMEPIKVAHKGTFTIKDNQITISAPDSDWMTGTHTIESLNEKDGNMEWTITTPLGKGKTYFLPTTYTNLPNVSVGM